MFIEAEENKFINRATELLFMYIQCIKRCQYIVSKVEEKII